MSISIPMRMASRIQVSVRVLYFFNTEKRPDQFNFSSEVVDFSVVAVVLQLKRPKGLRLMVLASCDGCECREYGP